MEIFHNECIKQTGVDPKVVEKVLKSTIVPEDEPSYENYLTCYYKKQRYQDEEGYIIYDNVQEFLEVFYDPSDAKKVVGNCKNLKGNSHGQNALFFVRCVLDGLKAVEAEEEAENQIIDVRSNEGPNANESDLLENEI